MNFLNKLKIPEIKIPKPKINIKFDKRTRITIISVVIILAITILGRKAPSKNQWENIIPDSDIFDSTALTGGKESFDDDKYTSFFFEVYDLVVEKYWNSLSDEQLGGIVKLGTEKITEKQIETTPSNKNQVRSIIQEAMKDMDETQKKEFIVQLTDMMLANLEPFGRSRLYTSKKKQDLTNTVMNIDPTTNHYDVLEVEKDSDITKIAGAYQEKISELNNQEQTEEVLTEKQKVEKAYEVIGDTGNKKVYDDLGVNPTIDNRLINPRVFYIHITKFSPTTVEELLRVMDKVDGGSELDTLIIDLRGNIGGAIDGLPYFLGPFIGNDQYAYQFFKRGEKQDFKTVTGWLPSLVRYKKVVILIDDQVQSSGEVFAATLKKFNVGVLVGVPTKGWGTVESVFRINNQLDPENEEYSALLVHSLTLREDGVPIEGKGVDPHINTTNPNWESELFRYFHYQELVDVVRNLLNS